MDLKRQSFQTYVNGSSEVDLTSVARLLWINLFSYDAFGCLQGCFALEIGRAKQPREIIRPSHAKCTENYEKWLPRSAFGRTLGLGKRRRHVQKVLFCIRILDICCRRPPGPDFIRNPVGRAWPESCLDRAGASGSYMGSRRKK